MAAAGEASASTLKKEEEALIHVLKTRAQRQCHDEQRAYAECVRGRVVSVAWACRAPARAMSECLNAFTSADALDALRTDWVAKGKPRLTG